jgi:hypothetical protein
VLSFPCTSNCDFPPVPWLLVGLTDVSADEFGAFVVAIPLELYT